jgi:hypothetical protein
MRDLTRLLRDADPVREEEGLAPADLQTMRRVVLAAVVEPAPPVLFWHQPLKVAFALVLTIVVGIVGGRLMVDREAGSSGTVSAANAGSSGSIGGDRLQLQFSTPGGTRIIWIFDQNLRLQESMP